MKCPQCGQPTEIVETRTWRDEFVRRRRQCPQKHRHTTLEMNVGTSIGGGFSIRAFNDLRLTLYNWINRAQTKTKQPKDFP